MSHDVYLPLPTLIHASPLFESDGVVIHVSVIVRSVLISGAPITTRLRPGAGGGGLILVFGEDTYRRRIWGTMLKCLEGWDGNGLGTLDVRVCWRRQMLKTMESPVTIAFHEMCFRISIAMIEDIFLLRTGRRKHDSWCGRSVSCLLFSFPVIGGSSCSI